MHMRNQEERRFTVILNHDSGFRFVSQASEDGVAHGQPYVSDEPDPVGAASGPATPALLGSAIGHCLSASLLESLRHVGTKVSGFETEITAVVKPNEEGFPRIDHVDVLLRPEVAEISGAVDGCAGSFENCCTVSSSLKKGIDIRVQVEWRVKG